MRAMVFNFFYRYRLGCLSPHIWGTKQITLLNLLSLHSIKFDKDR